ncbi:hypothetical protein RZS28_00610 [Methylocapsa polymorpha]|uniref:Uncharacterized protein n=1 Tax=Methylocapsa polymorpha TaxID=3080828 RepID=A0ABZ0HVC4_9HYPH|nr:hypothetical protein RZS28_00610 [Methylocapsa sp. RX1]
MPIRLLASRNEPLNHFAEIDHCSILIFAGMIFRDVPLDHSARLLDAPGLKFL